MEAYCTMQGQWSQSRSFHQWAILFVSSVMLIFPSFTTGPGLQQTVHKNGDHRRILQEERPRIYHTRELHQQAFCPHLWVCIFLARLQEHKLVITLHCRRLTHRSHSVSLAWVLLYVPMPPSKASNTNLRDISECEVTFLQSAQQSLCAGGVISYHVFLHLLFLQTDIIYSCQG